jgi:tRNA threonylcarbamoyladenosine modification (KEOPS) complex Cgi121 subunit
MPYSYPITGSNLYVTITATKNTYIKDINDTLKTLDKKIVDKVYQLFDADKIAGPLHLYYAAANAHHAIENENNISKKLDVETLLYASTQNQISKAIQTIGVSKKTQRIAVAVISKMNEDPATTMIAKYLGEIDDSALELTHEKYVALLELYEVNEIAIESVGGDKYAALTSLITEKSTLISLKR